MMTTVTGKNQVTIPAQLARRMGIGPGSKLDWTEGPGRNEIRIAVRPGPAELLGRVREIGVRYSTRSPDAASVLAALREEDDVTGHEASAKAPARPASVRKPT